MEKTLDLVSLNDDELLDVVGGCHQSCYSQPCGGGEQAHGVVVFAGIAFF